jgi:aryl-alcohol dehydrogenase-like predicted oxidoreductase
MPEMALPKGTRLEGRSAVFTDEAFDLLEAPAAFGAARQATMLEVAFGWLLAHAPVASVIAGAMTPDQVKANVAAGSWRPTTEDVAALRDLLRTSRAGG